jgi:hypothetical protein
MSLVGSEVDCKLGSIKFADETETHELYGEDLHPPISPKSGPEDWFLNDLDTQGISASALAQQIHQSHKSFGSNFTNCTDDFCTATDHLSLAYTTSDLDDSPFKQDPLSLSREEFSTTPSKSIFHDANMTSTSEPPHSHVHAAGKVYETAKDVWGWGKGVVVFRPFLGLAESVAGKVVGIAGSSLESIDGAINDKLLGLDEKFLDPAVCAVVTMLLGAASTTEGLIKPIITALLKPVGLLKGTDDTPETTAE